jgi:sugar lactone lactonase YvrE
MTEPQILLTGIAFGESPRWHDGRLWFADWGAGEILAVDPDGGAAEVIVRVDFPSFPLCFGWLPGGRLLVVARDGRLLRLAPDGELATHADLGALAGAGHPWNEIVVDRRGFAYVNNAGFAFPGGEFAPGSIAVLTPDGEARRVAEGVASPTGWPSTARR